MTTWVEIPGFTGYEISDQGQVRSLKPLQKQDHYLIRLLKPHSNHGRPAYWLYKQGDKYERNELALMKLCFERGNEG